MTSRSSAVRPEAVHQLRTTIRRVETLFSASVPAPGRKDGKLLKQLERLRRRAGRVRDLDAQIAALDGLRLESVNRDRARVMAFLEKARARREGKLLRGFEKEADRGLRKRLKRTSVRLPHEAKESGADEQRFLTAALDKFAAVVKLYPTLAEANLHLFRTASKQVRYLAEMAGESPKVAAVIEPLKRIQDAIGAWHDWVTLAATAESVLKPSGQVPLISALRASARSKYLEALRVTTDARRALLEMREARLQSAKRVPHPVVPPTTPVARAATA